MSRKRENKVDMLDVFFAIFLTLKMCDLIRWSWWWVCFPIILSLVFGIARALAED